MLVVLGFALSGSAAARGHSHGAMPAPAGNAGAMERRKAISVFDAPAKTAEYAVKEASVLDHLHAGDRIRFTAVLQGRALVITRIVVAK